MNFEIEANLDNSMDTDSGRWGTGDVPGRFLFFTAAPGVSGWQAYSSGDGTTLSIDCPLSSDLSLDSLFMADSATWTEKTGTRAAAEDHSSGQSSTSTTITDSHLSIYP